MRHLLRHLEFVRGPRRGLAKRRLPIFVLAGLVALICVPPALGQMTAAQRLAIPGKPAMGGIPDVSGSHIVRAASTGASTPAAVDLSQYNPPVGNQGPVNSCSAWATMYYLRGWYAKRDGYYPGGPDALGGFAPMFSYSQYSQPASLGFNHGMTMQGSLDILMHQGVDTRVDYWQGDINQIDPPTSNELANAGNYRIASYAIAVNNGGTSMEDSIKQTLASGNPVAIGLNIYSNDVFSNVGPSTNYVVYPPPAGSTVVNFHDVFAYKYDQNGLWIENQWGTGWGKHGFAELSWAFVNQAVLEAASILPFTPPQSAPQPVGSLVATPDGSLYRVTTAGPSHLGGYAAAGWATEYGYTEDEGLPSNPSEYDCTPTACTAADDDPVDPIITSVRSLAAYTGPPGSRYCASEGDSCTPPEGVGDVAYGANGSFHYKYGIATVGCNNATFGDPLYGVPKACFTVAGPVGYGYCASEGQACGPQWPTDVAYGANGHFVYQSGMVGVFSCTNAFFGVDPIFGVHKACFTDFAPLGYHACASEGQACLLVIPRDVAYGANGRYVYRYGIVGLVSCTNAFFGVDPAPYVHKGCFTISSPPGFTYCTTEGGGTCTAQGKLMAYGADGRFDYRYLGPDSMGCSNSAFGSDPAPYIHKACFVYTGISFAQRKPALRQLEQTLGRASPLSRGQWVGKPNTSNERGVGG